MHRETAIHPLKMNSRSTWDADAFLSVDCNADSRMTRDSLSFITVHDYPFVTCDRDDARLRARFIAPGETVTRVACFVNHRFFFSPAKSRKQNLSIIASYAFTHYVFD